MSQPISEPSARRVSRRWPLISGGVALALVLALGAIVGLRANPYGFDAEWLEELVEHRSPLWNVPALVMSFLGGGWFGVFLVPIGVAVVLLIARKPWSAFYFVLASALSAGVVQLLKNLFARARPEEILVAADFGSFPSGHVANAATISVALAIILQRRWVWFAGAAWTVLMIFSRTYLGAHWLSDTIGGLLLGGAVAVFVWAPFALRLQKEWSPPAAPDSVSS
ncbi:MAG: Phosphatase family protein [Rhodoglobus sp.]|jgi:membrane-associated phospholipid phosphatase|nr:Phosphatase family protein [Rhodoglobus sp.]